MICYVKLNIDAMNGINPMTVSQRAAGWWKACKIDSDVSPGSIEL